METELIGTQFAVAWATATVLEWLKGKPWFPFMSINSSQMNRAFSMIVAFFAALGIHWAMDWQAVNGTLVITVTGLSLGTVLHSVFAWVQQMAFQQASWKMLVKNGNGKNGNAVAVGGGQ